MRVVICLTHSVVGGGQEVVATLVEQCLARHRDLDVCVVLPAGGIFVERFKRTGVRVETLPFDRLSLSAALGWARLVRGLEPDVVHSHGKGAGFYARLLGPAKLPRVHTYHGFHPPGNPVLRRAYLLLEGLLARTTARVVAVSEGEAGEIRRAVPAAGDRVTVIPNVVVCRTPPGAPGEDEAELEAFVRRPGFVVAMIARDDPVKDYPLALNACERVLRRGGDTRFVFVGIDRRRSDLLRLEREFAGRVLALSSLASTARLIARMDLLLLTSRKEGAPLVVLEAQCAGKPVVATDVPGVRDLVADGVDGLLVPPTAVAVGDAVLRAAGDRALWRRMAEQAAQKAAGRDVARWSAAYYELYRSLTGE